MIVYETLSEEKYQDLLDCYKRVIETNIEDNQEVQETLAFCSDRFDDEVYYYLAEKLLTC